MFLQYHGAVDCKPVAEDVHKIFESSGKVVGPDNGEGDVDCSDHDGPD